MPDLLLIGLFFLVALFYSSIGFGGGSSYLALLSLFFGDFHLIRTIALLCNVAVVLGSVVLYYRRGLIDLRKFLPFVLVSMPAALLGAQFRLSQQLFFIILGGALIVSALMLLLKTVQRKEVRKRDYAKGVTYSLSGGIGFLSGLVGIGGGIFLSPTLNLMQWETPKKIAALASFFILANSLAGLSGLALSGDLQLNYPLFLYLILAVIAGGQIGSRMTVNVLRPEIIKLLTACLVLYVGLRLLLWHSMGVKI